MQTCNCCDEGYDDGDMIIKCGVCKRWCHAECDQITTEEDAEKCSQEGMCLIRPKILAFCLISFLKPI